MVHDCGVIVGPRVNLHELFLIDFDIGKEWMMRFEYKNNGLNVLSLRVIRAKSSSPDSIKNRLIQLN